MKKNLLTDLEDENSMNTTRHASYKRIDISSDEEIAKMLTDCDDDQKIVIDIAVTYTRSWKKSQKGLSKPNDAPLLIVQGGAGSGKSRLINLISEGGKPNTVLLLCGGFYRHPRRAIGLPGKL